jgi:hypothetical protein
MNINSKDEEKDKNQPSGTPSKDRSMKNIHGGGGQKRIELLKRFFLKP